MHRFTGVCELLSISLGHIVESGIKSQRMRMSLTFIGDIMKMCQPSTLRSDGVDTAQSIGFHKCLVSEIKCLVPKSRCLFSEIMCGVSATFPVTVTHCMANK